MILAIEHAVILGVTGLALGVTILSVGCFILAFLYPHESCDEIEQWKRDNQLYDISEIRGITTEKHMILQMGFSPPPDHSLAPAKAGVEGVLDNDPAE
jgi:hypothetical protein